MILKQTVLEDWEYHVNKASQLKDDVEKRITEVLGIWWGAFGGVVKSWGFETSVLLDTQDAYTYVKDGYIIDLHVNFAKTPCGNLYTPHGDTFTIIDVTEKYFSWEGKIPVRWLYEDCKEEIVNGKIKYEKVFQDRRKQYEISLENAKHDNNQTALNALSKLTIAEYHAILKNSKIY